MPRSGARIAVLMPAYNAEETILRSLDSLRANTEPHDIIVVDDGSRVPLEGFLPKRDNLIILRMGNNKGIVGALNDGLRYIVAHGYEFIARMDADDTVVPERLSVQRAFLDDHPEIGMVGSWGRVVSKQGKTVFFLNHPERHEDILKALYYNSCFLHPALFFRASLMARMGGYRDAYAGAEDYDFVRRMASLTKTANIPQYLIDYTMAPSGLSLSQRRLQLSSRLKIQWACKDFKTIHFYLGMIKTIVLMFMPYALVAAMKRAKKTYRARA